MEQHNDVGTKEDLCKYRIDVAKQDLESARLLFDNSDYRGANNRAYYAIFHVISAIHALDEKAYKKHKDAIANFNKDYVKTGIFSRELGKKISVAEEIRHASDYSDFYIATVKEAKNQIESADELIQCIEEYCSNRIGSKTND